MGVVMRLYDCFQNKVIASPALPNIEQKTSVTTDFLLQNVNRLTTYVDYDHIKIV